MKTIIRIIALALAFSTPLQAESNDADVFKARRETLMESLDGGVAVLYGATDSGGSIVKGGFIQESSFYYLTGISEPGAALILAPGERRYKEILFLQSRDPDVENWDGRREPLGEALNEATGFDRVVRINTLPSNLTAMLQRSKKAVFLGPIVSAKTDIPEALGILRAGQSRVPGTSLVNMAHLIPEMRRIKDGGEIEQLKKAINVTGKGILAAMKSVEPGMLEFQLQSVVEGTQRHSSALRAKQRANSGNRPGADRYRCRLATLQCRCHSDDSCRRNLFSPGKRTVRIGVEGVGHGYQRS
jgi:Xaa-Pro aminopeptidase